MRRPRPHSIALVSGFAALGLITSLVIAWSVAIFGGFNARRGAPLPTLFLRDGGGGGAPEATLSVHRTASFGRWKYLFVPMEPEPGTAPGLGDIRARDLPRWARPAWHGSPSWAEGFGWPVACLSGENRFAPEGVAHSFVRLEGWSPSSGDVWLPVRPVWTGLAVDAALWGSAWGAVLVLPGALIRRRRRRGGRCPRCAYDLRGTPAGAACPECGHAPRGAA